MLLYLVSNETLREKTIGKIGMTQTPYERLSTYLTGCPPKMDPCCDLEFDGLWEVDAETRDELYNFEAQVHNYFRQFRLMRERLGDSEWFNFQGKYVYTEVDNFIQSRPWFIRKVNPEEVLPVKVSARYMQTYYDKNLINFITDSNERIKILDFEQEPVIGAIRNFLSSSTQAAKVIAPCGFGKTVVTVKGCKDLVKRIAVCAPFNSIQLQWRDTFLRLGMFTLEEILIIGGIGTTNPQEIRNHLQKDKYCIITTYMSSHILESLVSVARLELQILDEAHHLGGRIAEAETGEGRTRRLMETVTKLGIKRLSLTFTERIITDDDNTGFKYFTMDDEAVFGQQIANINIRQLIRKGILPDYRLWSLYDKEQKGTGVRVKAECILEAWNAEEVERDEITNIINHLIVFASTIEEADELTKFLKEKTTNTVVQVKQGDNVASRIAEFTKAKRSIIVNCQMLGEGVDIPIADSVAITYPKKSQGQITQMILRAGRWHKNKPIFHILLPIIDDEDFSGFESVLLTLASNDSQIRDELMLLAMGPARPGNKEPTSNQITDVPPECIMIEQYEGSDIEGIKLAFKSVHSRLNANSGRSKKEFENAQRICAEHSIRDSKQYGELQTTVLNGLPVEPSVYWQGYGWTNFYDFLHGTERAMALDKFIDDIINELQILTAEEWQTKYIAGYPTLQDICDGYFAQKNIQQYADIIKHPRVVKSRGFGARR